MSPLKLEDGNPTGLPLRLRSTPRFQRWPEQTATLSEALDGYSVRTSIDLFERQAAVLRSPHTA